MAFRCGLAALCRRGGQLQLDRVLGEKGRAVEDVLAERLRSLTSPSVSLVRNRDLYFLQEIGCLEGG